ncbi:MAG TPA: HD domain-containing protein [Nitriliruptoraceae bacterium]|nr:HD domain-containing protein [Nitriliruptoraceae bacterium]
MATLTIGTTVDEVLALVDELDELAHAGQDLRTLAHRGAALALAEGGDDELVVATLLHDIGRVRYLAKAAPGIPHEEVGRRFVADRFSDRCAWLVAQHVVAQRYLATVDPDYVGTLTRQQATALRHAGGKLSAQRTLRLESETFTADAVRLRRWADRAVTESVSAPSPAALGRAIESAWVR